MLLKPKDRSKNHSINDENDHIPTVGSGNVSIDIDKEKSMSDKIKKRGERPVGKNSAKRDHSDSHSRVYEMHDVEDAKRMNSNTSLRKEQQSLEHSRHEEKSIDMMSDRKQDRERERERERRKYQEYLKRKNDELMRKNDEHEHSVLSKQPSNHS